MKKILSKFLILMIVAFGIFIPVVNMQAAEINKPLTIKSKGTEDFLARGIDARVYSSGNFNLSDLKKSIFNTDAIYYDEYANHNAWETTSKCYTNVNNLEVEFAMDWENITNEKVANKHMKCEADKRFKIDEKVSVDYYFNSIFYYSHGEVVEKNTQLCYANDYSIYMNKTTSYFKQYVNNLNDELKKGNTDVELANKFFDLFGTHIITNASYGAKIDCFYTYTTTKYDISNKTDVEVAIGSGVSIGNGKTGAMSNKNIINGSLKVLYSNGTTSETIHAEGVGGQAFVVDDIKNFTSSINTYYSKLYDDNNKVKNPDCIEFKASEAIWNYISDDYSLAKDFLKEAYNANVNGCTLTELGKITKKYENYFNHNDLIVKGNNEVTIEVPQVNFKKLDELGYKSAEIEVKFYIWNLNSKKYKGSKQWISINTNNDSTARNVFLKQYSGYEHATYVVETMSIPDLSIYNTSVLCLKFEAYGNEKSNSNFGISNLEMTVTYSK